MLDSGGGTGGGTPWAYMTIDAMRNLIHGADIKAQEVIAEGWSMSAQLVDSHRTQVKNYRDNLASAWPPEKNKAAAAYLDRLDVMIADLTETHEAAVTNRRLLTEVNGWIYQAQLTMDSLHETHQENEAKLAAFKAQQGNPQPTPSPGDKQQPPVSAEQQESLRSQAIVLLNGVSTKLAETQLQVRTPKLYEPGLQIDNKRAEDGAYPAPPPLPPIIPIASGSGRSSTSARQAVTPAGQGIISPVATAQPGLILGGPAGPSGLGPTLTTANPIAPTVIAPSGLPQPLPAGGPGPVPSIGPFSAVSGRPPLGTPPLSPTTPLISTTPKTGPGSLRPGFSGPEGMRAFPSGQVIGGTPGMPGGAVAGRGGSGSMRANPVGGVIGGGGPGMVGGGGAVGRGGPGMVGRGAAGSAGMPATAHGGAYGPSGGRNSGQRDAKNEKTWDPDNPWETAKGVDPVVMPAREQRIDPGPAIGLGRE